MFRLNLCSKINYFTVQTHTQNSLLKGVCLKHRTIIMGCMKGYYAYFFICHILSIIKFEILYPQFVAHGSHDFSNA